MMSSPLLLLLTATSLAVAEMGQWNSEFTYSTYLEENHQFRLYWSHLDDDVIDIGMEANTTGWIAVGLSPNGGMENSDIMIGWVDDDGSVILQDRYTGDSMSRPSLDDDDHLTLIEGEQEDGITRIRFQRTRTLDCDDTSGHDIAVSQGTSRVIYAWNDNDGDEDDADSIAYHGANQRGSQSVNLWYGESEVVEIEDDAQSIDLLMSNWSVSSEDTTYVCKLFEIPRFNDTQHVVKLEPIVQEGNEGTVHHITFYVCPEDWVDTSVEITDSHQIDCDDWTNEAHNMPSADCRGARLEYAWAIGGKAQYYPKEAGLPMSGDSSFHYVFMITHYDNPEERSDIVDSSGVRMWYTPTLRQYDAGIMSFGLMVNPYFQFTVPGTVTTLTGYCHSDCSNAGLEEEGAIVFGSMLHAHTTGTAISLRHIRDGVELEPLEVNDHYDFDFQQTTFYDEHVTILPGDQFIVHCTYDTTDRDEMVLAGEASDEEMCIAFVYVYPKPDLFSCNSGINPEAVSDWLDDAYDQGYWDITNSLNGSVSSIEDLMDSGNITRPGDVVPADWDLYGGFWNQDMEGAAAFYDKIWSDPEYDERFSQCWNPDTGYYSRNITSFEEEFGEFEEYCTDPCGCEDSDSVDDHSDAQANDNEDGNGLMVAVIILAILLGAAFVVIVYLCWRNSKLEEQTGTNAHHPGSIPSGSVTAMGGE